MKQLNFKVFRGTRDLLQAIPGRVVPMLEGKDNRERESLILKAVNDALTGIEKHAKPPTAAELSGIRESTLKPVIELLKQPKPDIKQALSCLTGLVDEVKKAFYISRPRTNQEN